MYQYPKDEILLKIVRDYPHSAYLYILLFNKSLTQNPIVVNLSDIRSQYSIEITKFRRDITALQKGEFVIYMEDKKGNLYIEFPENEIDAKDNCLC